MATRRKMYRALFNNSYQRAVSPDFHGFVRRFYELFTAADTAVAALFAQG